MPPDMDPIEPKLGGPGTHEWTSYPYKSPEEQKWKPVHGTVLSAEEFLGLSKSTK